jgi:hypothetical protein
MQTTTLISLAFSLTALGASGAQKPRADSSTFSSSLASSFVTIHIDLPGDIVLHAWDEPRVEVRVVDQVTGRLVGYSNSGSRAAYAVDFTPTDRGIVVAPRRRASSVAIGISTLEEHLHHDVYLPFTARVCVEDNKNDLTIDGRFAALDIARSAPTALKVRDDRSPGARLADCAATAAAAR